MPFHKIVYSFSLFLTNSFGTLLFSPVITSPRDQLRSDMITVLYPEEELKKHVKQSCSSYDLLSQTFFEIQIGHENFNAISNQCCCTLYRRVKKKSGAERALGRIAKKHSSSSGRIMPISDILLPS